MCEQEICVQVAGLGILVCDMVWEKRRVCLPKRPLKEMYASEYRSVCRIREHSVVMYLVLYVQTHICTQVHIHLHTSRAYGYVVQHIWTCETRLVKETCVNEYLYIYIYIYLYIFRMRGSVSWCSWWYIYAHIHAHIYAYVYICTHQCLRTWCAADLEREMWHDSCTRDLMDPCRWQDSFICGTWLSIKCDMTQSYVWHDSIICGQNWFTWLIYTWDMAHSYLWHDSVICGHNLWGRGDVTWLICVCSMTHSTCASWFVTCVTWLMHTPSLNYIDTVI